MPPYRRMPRCNVQFPPVDYGNRYNLDIYFSSKMDSWRLWLFRVVYPSLEFLLCPSMEQFARVGECGLLGQLVVNWLDVKDWNIKLVNILPRFVPRIHDVRFDVFKGAPFLELKHGVFGSIA
jgi:hypothetical protein